MRSMDSRVPGVGGFDEGVRACEEIDKDLAIGLGVNDVEDDGAFVEVGVDEGQTTLGVLDVAGESEGRWRFGSPPGGSTLMTSAPKSPSHRAAYEAGISPYSMMRRWLSAAC